MIRRTLAFAAGLIPDPTPAEPTAPEHIRYVPRDLDYGPVAKLLLEAGGSSHGPGSVHR